MVNATALPAEMILGRLDKAISAIEAVPQINAMGIKEQVESILRDSNGYSLKGSRHKIYSDISVYSRTISGMTNRAGALKELYTIKERYNSEDGFLLN